MPDIVKPDLRTPEINRGYEMLVANIFGTVAGIGATAYEGTMGHTKVAMLCLGAAGFMMSRVFDGLNSVHNMEQAEERRAERLQKGS